MTIVELLERTNNGRDQLVLTADEAEEYRRLLTWHPRSGPLMFQGQEVQIVG